MQTTKTPALDRLFSATTPGIWSPSAHVALRWAAASTIGHSNSLQGAGLLAPGVRYEQDGTALIQIISIINLSAEPIGLMAIQADGALRYTHGMQTDGSAIAVGPATPNDEVIFITEGYRTAAAIYTAMAGKIQGYAALHASNIHIVTGYARRHHPNAFILVCANDDSAGRMMAEATTPRIKGTCAIFPKAPYTDEIAAPVRDFADLLIKHGKDVVHKQIAPAIAQALETNAARRAELTRLQALVPGS